VSESSGDLAYVGMHTMSVLCRLCSGDEAFYPTSNTLGVGEHKDSEEGVNRMVEDLEKQYVMHCTRVNDTLALHSSASVVRATIKVNGEGQTLTPRHP